MDLTVSHGLYLSLNLHSIAPASMATALSARGDVYCIRQSGLGAQAFKPALNLTARKYKVGIQRAEAGPARVRTANEHQMLPKLTIRP